MPRCKSRVAKSRARKTQAPIEDDLIALERAVFEGRFEELLARVGTAGSFQERIDAMDQFEGLLKEIASSDTPLWPFARMVHAPVSRDARTREDYAAFGAMIAQAVAPHLIWGKPKLVKRQQPPK